MSQPARIMELDGLRGLLAWWVVLIHTLEFCGHNSTPVLNLFFPIEVVNVFIILSGFVIFYLIDTRSETYWVYLFRRFARIFPVYFVVLLAALCCLNILESNADLNPAFAGFRREIAESTRENLSWHIAAHIPMLHGMVPEKFLPYSSVAILAPAWSISLEWQFYLIAPLAAGLARKWPACSLALLGLVGVEWLSSNFHMPRFSTPSFLPLNFRYFLLGIASYYFFKWLSGMERKFTWPAAFYPLLATLCALFLAKDCLALAVWVLVFVPIVVQHCSFSPPDGLSKIVIQATRSSFLQYLGKVSFVTYLCHELILNLALHFIFQHHSLQGKMIPFWVLTVAAWPLILLVSAVLHRIVEAPCISFGRRYFQIRNGRFAGQPSSP